ncbi:MAG: DnaJ domain-containing protein [Synergistaceae bacterium]|nr:DnaJ domain-containing protein [Synergistaceae bacterium]
MKRDAKYEALGLSPDASWEEVKRAFRQLARIYHPDVAGPDGARKFAEITEAYMTLKEITSGDRHAPSRHAPASFGESAGGGVEIKESFFRRLWRKLFSRKRARIDADAGEGEIPPVRARFIGSVISRAESEIQGILSRKGEFTARSRTDAVIRRLKSRHPAVVILALRQISIRSANGEMAEATIEHFRKNMPMSETLEQVLDVFSNSPRRGEFASAMLSHLHKFAERDALVLLNRIKRWKLSREYLKPFLSHGSPSVIAGALNCWPDEMDGRELPEISGLLVRDEEAILVPLLRLLKRRKHQDGTGRIGWLMREHPSPAVRVWASAIVRDQNLS